MLKVIGFYAKALTSASKGIGKKTIIVDKPWALIDNENEIQKLIFKRDGELILSKNGKVEVGKWEYLPEASCLLIDRVTDRLLLQEQYIDDNIMILRKDGTDNEFFALANANTLPDYDVLKYLNRKRREAFAIKEILLRDGKVLEVQFPNSIPEMDLSLLNRKAFLKEKEIIPQSPNGVFFYQKSNRTLHICKGIIKRVMGFEVLETFDGKLIEVEYNLDIEDFPRRVTLNGEPINTGKILLKGRKSTLYVENGYISQITNNAWIKSNDGAEYEVEDGSGRMSYENLVITQHGRPVTEELLFEINSSRMFVKESKIIKFVFPKTYKLSKGYEVEIEQKQPNFPQAGDMIIKSKPIFPLPNGGYRVLGTLRWIRSRNSMLV